MIRRKKLEIRKGKIITGLISIVLSPVLIPVAITGAVCDFILEKYMNLRHWCCVKIDGKKRFKT